MSRIVTSIMAVLFVVAAAAVSHAGATAFNYTTGIQDTMAANFWPKSNQGKQPSMYVYNNSTFRAQSLIRLESLFGGGAGESGAGLMGLSCRGAD